jgi:hypothetical protein
MTSHKFIAQLNTQQRLRHRIATWWAFRPGVLEQRQAQQVSQLKDALARAGLPIEVLGGEAPAVPAGPTGTLQ